VLNNTLDYEAFALLDTGCDMSVTVTYLLPQLEISDNPFLYQGKDTVHGD